MPCRVYGVKSRVKPYVAQIITITVPNQMLGVKAEDKRMRAASH